MAGIDDAGRAIAGLLTYNPGPGIYSRLERAIEAMPDNVRVQELPGLLKRYKDGVPGWELKAVDLDSVIAGRDAVPKSELLAAVKGRSPVYTHKEMVLDESGPRKVWPGLSADSQEPGAVPSSEFPKPSRIGAAGATRHGQPVYKEYGQGGDDYTELLLTQPNAYGYDFGSHWGDPDVPGRAAAVAHARFDTHGDALRINELQSDLGIYNRRIREAKGLPPAPARAAGESDSDYVDRLERLGYEMNWNGGAWEAENAGLPFPLEDAWSDLLIKRLALEAARKGHRAIEVASPRAIADKVGGNIDNYEHFYGKVVPGALERLGRKMGGLTLEQARLTPEPSPTPHYGESARRMEFRTTDALNDAITLAHGWVGRQRGQRSVGDPFEEMVDAMSLSNDYREQAAVMSHAQEVHDRMVRTAIDNGYPEEAAKTLVARAMPGIMRDAENVTALRHARARLAALARESPPPAAMPAAPGRRYIMSDEMRRRLIEQGVGASVLAPLLATEEE